MYQDIKWDNRLIGIKGARGTGKTTLLLQRFNEIKTQRKEAIYLSLDDLYFADHKLTETIEELYRVGISTFFLDEVHKYKGWSHHIKNIYDFFPEINIIFTGSSILDINKEQADISRRVIMYEMVGLSFREYLSLNFNIEIPVISLDEMINKRQKIDIPLNFSPYKYFEGYLRNGYYPFFKDNIDTYHQRLSQLIRLIVEVDMAELKDFDIRNANKILQLLKLVAVNAPFKPNISKISDKTGIHRTTIYNYLYFLEQANLLHLLYPAGVSHSTLQKPGKLYLNNTNLVYVLSNEVPDIGNNRETFFINQLKMGHEVRYPKQGDFLVNNKYTFEVGGKGKTLKQIVGVKNSFVVADNIDHPVSNSIPLWMFGMLY